MNGHGQRGAAAIDFVLLVPLLLLLIGLVVGGARIWLARAAVVQSASSAARGASLARSVAEAHDRGAELADQQLSVDGLRCEHRAVSIEAGVLARPPGTAGTVAATVRCTVPLGDVIVPGWPGGVELTHTATAVVDRYRGRA